MAATFSLKEAAAIADVSERDVRKAIEAKTIRPRIVLAGRAPRYRFSAHDLLYLKLLADFPLSLGREDKQALQEIIETKLRSSGRWQRGEDDIIVQSGDVLIRVQVKPLRNNLVHRLKAFQRGRRRIVSNPAVMGGEPVFEGTRIPLAHVAGLFAKNVPVDEIVEDYPSLVPEDLEFAALVARMRPNPGRPRKPLVLVRNGSPIDANHENSGACEAPAG
jgi:uncharacterized protein (DUF433 family)